MKFFCRKSSIIKWVILKASLEDIVEWALKAIPGKTIVRWALRLIVLVLRSPYVEFKYSVHDLAVLIAQKLADGVLSDEDTADILEELIKYIR